MSDDELDRALAALRALCDASEIVRLESAFIASPDGHDGPCPMPNDVHPAYSGHAWLIEWVNERGPYADRWDIRVPVSRPSAWRMSPDEQGPVTPTLDARLLTRRLCWGLAPYVGAPFVYTWYAGIDEYGRGVAGDAHIQPLARA